MMINPPVQVRGLIPASAWDQAKKIVNEFGSDVITEDGALTREIRNLSVYIESPSIGWPIKGSGWNLPALEVYAKDEILSKQNKTGFDYTYGERLAYQMARVIKRLRQYPTTRRAVATTWQKSCDQFSKNPPCLMAVDFLVRGGELQLIAFFRSWDVGRAAVANMYGLYKLMDRVARKTGTKIGSLTIIAASAHVYYD